jgi:hypothetical protein
MSWDCHEVLAALIHAEGSLPPGDDSPKAFLIRLRPAIINGHPYWVDWEALPVTGSVFFPTTATAVQVLRELKWVREYYAIGMFACTRRERRLHGVRVWRVF